MSNIAVFNPGAMRPAFATSAPLSAIAKALAGSGMSGKRLSIKGGVFRLIVDGKEVTALEERHLDVVIVRAAEKVSRTFYAGQYVDGQATAPACWSSNGDLPDASIKTPQGKSCATCPQNVKGSGQGESRACRYNQQLAVVLANDMEGDVLQLSLAATSIFGKGEGENRPLQDYVRYYASMSPPVDVAHVVTRLRFDTNAPVPKLFFRPARYLTVDEHEVAQAQGGTPEAERAVTMTVSQTDGVAPVAAPAPMAIPGSPPKTKAAPAPVVAQAEEDDEPPPPPTKVKPKAKPAAVTAPVEEEPVEPVVRKAAPAATAAAPAASSLAQALADWDDE